MLLAGLWCSTQKPPSFSFLEPVMNQLKNLEEKRIYIIHCPLYYIPCNCSRNYSQHTRNW